MNTTSEIKGDLRDLNSNIPLELRLSHCGGTNINISSRTWLLSLQLSPGYIRCSYVQNEQAGNFLTNNDSDVAVFRKLFSSCNLVALYHMQI